MKADLQKSIIRGLKYLLIIYALLSLTYTANQLYQQSASSPSLATRSTRRSIAIEKPLHQRPVSYEKSKVDNVIQSKMFSGTMRSNNSKILPYYIKATQITNLKDITISTIVTSDRLPVLSRLASHYKGPISAAIHINENDKDKKELVLQQLLNVYIENEDMQRYVDIHLIADQYDRQFNMWRNVAKLYARTDYIMMLDIDFFPCTNFRQDILQHPEWLNMLDDGLTAFVVPAFEYIDLEDGIDYKTFPRTKQDLIDQVTADKLDMFHRAWQLGHGATDYVKWYDASTPMYKVVNYHHSYEPYVIFKRQGSPWCDERFIGYGANKAACLYEIYLSGISYYVLSDHFLIHQSHTYPESARRKERSFNRKLYTHFREELCLRYARQFIATGEWNTSRADNLKTECQKIRGFTDTIL
ncbi:unnamed protein product [Rhizopus microsporus]|uniref:Glycosyltransferase family 49 protein n=1 Tax=Rhizopus microsporus TaxID=58291 RepID=A0A1X0S916_RHIZD|nr:hypothetical protein BCV71DRAFT_289399 [Rhizopus microsporus]